MPTTASRMEADLRRVVPLAARDRSHPHASVFAAAAFEVHRRRALADPGLHPLRAARLDAGLTLEGLAERALVCRATVWNCEQGRAASEMTWRRLARALDVDVSAIRAE